MAFGRKQEQIEALTEELRIQTENCGRLHEDLDNARAVGRIAASVSAELEKAEEIGEMREIAESEAFIAVTAMEKERLTSELSRKLQEDEYDRFASNYRIEEGPKILASLQDLFSSDGTYERIHEEARADVRAELQAEVLEGLKTKAKKGLEEPDQKQAAIAEIRTKLADSDELSAFRTNTKLELEETWRNEVWEEVKTEVVAEEKSRETDFKKAEAENVRGSDGTAKFRATTRKDLEATWSKATIEEITAAIKDEELHSLLDEKAEQEKQKLRDEIESKKLLKDFESFGVDVSDLPENTKLEIYLGEYKTFQFEEKYQDNYGYDKKRTVNKKGIACKRTLTLLSRDKGIFVVHADSLHDSASIYERATALRRGTTITIGRKLEEDHHEILEPRVAADVPFYYDDDLSTPEFSDSLLPVANIKINGLSARKVEHLEMIK